MEFEYQLATGIYRDLPGFTGISGISVGFTGIYLFFSTAQRQVGWAAVEKIGASAQARPRLRSQRALSHPYRWQGG